MPNPTYTVEIAFTSNSYTNITSDCLRLSINRELATYESGLSMGRCEFIVDNNQKKYSPLNSASPYYGYLNPNRPVRVNVTYITSTYTLFTGFLDALTIDPQFGKQSVHIQASDVVKNLKAQTISMPIRANINVGSLVSEILSYATVPVSDRHVHSFTDTLAFSWFEKREPIGILNDLLTYGYYNAYVAGNGQIHVHDRLFALEETVVGSYSEFYGLTYNRSEEDMGNIVKVTGHPRKLSTSINTIAWITDLVTIPGSGYASFWLTYVDPETLESDTPAQSVMAPVSSMDYLAYYDTLGLSTNLTSNLQVSTGRFGTTAVCSIFNTKGTKANLLKFQLRGYSIQQKPPVSFETESSSSQTLYGKKNYEVESDLISEFEHTQNYANFLLYTHKDPENAITVTLKNQWPDILDLELSNIINIDEDNTSINAPCTIKSLDHDISFERGIEHVANYNVQIWDDADILILDHPTRGIVGRRLGF